MHLISVASHTFFSYKGLADLLFALLDVYFVKCRNQAKNLFFARLI